METLIEDRGEGGKVDIGAEAVTSLRPLGLTAGRGDRVTERAC